MLQFLILIPLFLTCFFVTFFSFLLPPLRVDLVELEVVVDLTDEVEGGGT